MIIGIRRVLFGPIQDYVDGLNVCFARRRARALVLVLVGAALSWWVYVPIHELSHAYGCILTGGTVTRLDISPLYAAAWLQRFFPFISVGSEYAGRLSGFDTHGSDWVYLATDAAPFLWTILIGVPLLRGVSSGSAWQTLRFGAALPIAFAPFISLTGDYYEMGSVVVSRAVAVARRSYPFGRWRSDDVFRLLQELSETTDGVSAGDVAGIAAGLLVGAVLAFATYWLGVGWSDLVHGRSRARATGNRRLAAKR